MDVQQAILQRRSTRGFEKTPLTQQEIDTLVQAALAAPSAMNKQPWHFAFVKDAGLLKEFNALAREHMLKNGPAPLRPRFEDPNYELLMGAPLFVILSTDPTADGPFHRRGLRHRRGKPGPVRQGNGPGQRHRGHAHGNRGSRLLQGSEGPHGRPRGPSL